MSMWDARIEAKKMVQKIYDFTEHMQWNEAKGLAEMQCDMVIDELNKTMVIVLNKDITNLWIRWVKVKAEIQFV